MTPVAARSADVRTAWAGLALAPTSWYAMHLAVSTLAPERCGGSPALTLLPAVLAALLTAGGGILSYRFLNTLKPDDTRRFVGWLGVAAALLFLFVILAQGAAGLLYTGCER